jgi:hypothetical protein
MMTAYDQLIEDSIRLKALMQLFGTLDSTWALSFHSLDYVSIVKYKSPVFGDVIVNLKDTQNILDACVYLEVYNRRFYEQQKRTGEI